jgi:hypothetical protein
MFWNELGFTTNLELFYFIVDIPNEDNYNFSEVDLMLAISFIFRLILF